MRDNAALKTISENQRRIDSAAMRVISAITAVFLPATFTTVRAFALKQTSLEKLWPYTDTKARHYSALHFSTSRQAEMDILYLHGFGYTSLWPLYSIHLFSHYCTLLGVVKCIRLTILLEEKTSR